MSFSDPGDPEVLLASESEEAELEAAAHQLTQDFLCQMMQEDKGGDRGSEDDPPGAGPEVEGEESVHQIAPLDAVLGKLTGPVTFDLHQTFDTSEGKSCCRQTLLVLLLVLVSTQCWVWFQTWAQTLESWT